MDDGYGKVWEYRVFSEMWTEPDVPESGKRHLTVHSVCYNVPLSFLGTRDYPLHDDVIYIEAEPASPEGVGLEATLQDAERIMKAFDRPVMIRAEWQKFFDHSEEQNRLSEQQAKAMAQVCPTSTAM